MCRSFAATSISAECPSGERADDSGSPPYLEHPFEWMVGPDLPPVHRWIGIITERFSDALDGHIYDWPPFIGREAAMRDRDTTHERRLVTLNVDAKDADAAGYEPINLGDRLVGFVPRALRRGEACDGSFFDPGTYPEVPLESAKARNQAARQLLALGVNPAGRRKALRQIAANKL